jgi:stage III sporulation protein AG
MAPIKWNRIFEKIQNKSGKEKITIVVLTGILLLVISLPTGSKSGQTETNENTQTRQTGLSESAKSYETVLEEKLEKALKKVEGVGEVSVVITLKNTSEKIIAADSDYSESVIQESDSAGGVRSTTQQSGSTSNIYYDTQEGSEPYVTKENMPEVEGIVIVAKGGGDGNVCVDITAAAEALLGVPAHKIKVLKMN